MQNLGSTFRDMRQQRHLTLQAVADAQCSVAFISKFERGERAIGFMRLWHLLDRINVTPEEFFAAVRPDLTTAASLAPEIAPLASLTTPYAGVAVDLVHATASNTADSANVSSQAVAAMARIGEAVLTRDGGTARWQQFMLIQRQLGVEIVRSNQQTGAESTALFAYLKQASQPVVAYLFTLESWGIFEFTLLRLFAAAVDAETLYRLIKLAVARSQAVRRLPQGEALVMVVLQGAVSKFINARRFDWVADALAWRKAMTPEDGVRWALESRFLSGWAAMAQGDAGGESQCRTVVSMLETLGLSRWATLWRRRLGAIEKSIADPKNWSVYL